MKKLTSIMLMAFFAISSCKKTDDPIPTPSQPAFSLVGTWSLTEAKVTIDSKTTTLTPAAISQGVYPTADFVFTSDGKYTRGKESGNWVLTAGQLQLGDLTYEYLNTDASVFQIGNTFNDFQAQMNITRPKQNAVGTSQDLLNLLVPVNTLNSISYRVIYKKK